MEWTIDDETPADVAAREELLDGTMGPSRTTVASEVLREGNSAVIALVARENGAVVGTVRLWPVTIPDAGATLLLGPLAVHDDRSGLGIGTLLMRDALDRASELGWEAVVLVGAPGYYERFGFVALDGVSMPGRSSPGRRLLGIELREGALRHAHGRMERAGEVARMAA